MYGVLGWPRRGIVGPGADHEHLADAGPERQDPRDDVDHRVASPLGRLGLQPLQRQVAGVVVHVREFLDLAPPGQHLQPAGDSPADPQRIGDVAHHEMAGLVARVDLAEQVLAGAGRREEGAVVLSIADRRAQGDELHQVADLPQLGAHSGQAAGALVLGLLLEPVDGGVAAIDDELGDAVDLAPGKRLQAAGDAADEPQRVDAVAHDDVARAVAELCQAVNLVARKPRHQHGHHPCRLARHPW